MKNKLKFVLPLAITAFAFAQEPAAHPTTETPKAEVSQPADTAATPAAPAADSVPVAETPKVEAPANEASQSASIFVQDPAIFHKHQDELKKLQQGLGSANEELDSLLQYADKIAKMNDHCSAISINDVMGEDCWDFYRVELPEFEARYMQVTGEVRLGYMETARGLEDRKKQIFACVDALYSLSTSKDQHVNLDGGVFLEPLTKGFQANYNFNLTFEPNHQKRAFEIAQKWGETCREMVVRQDGEGFAPFFLERVAKLNEDLSNEGSRAVYKVDTTGAPMLYLDNTQPVRSAYYLNGVKLFHTRINPGPASQSHLRISFPKGSPVKVDGESSVTKFDGTPAAFKGSVEFPQKSAKLNGRWIWENQGNTEGVDFGPAFDADSLQAAETTTAQEQKAAEDAEIEKRRGVHPSLWAAITGVGAIYDNEAALGYGLKKKDMFILPDVAAAVRVKLNFGEKAEGSFAIGAGGMVGFAIGDELERVYVAPLGQVELGYKFFGFRETAIFPIAKSDEEQWMQFRSGVFVSLWVFNIEVGYALITDMGNGAYVSLGVEW